MKSLLAIAIVLAATVCQAQIPDSFGDVEIRIRSVVVDVLDEEGEPTGETKRENAIRVEGAVVNSDGQKIKTVVLGDSEARPFLTDEFVASFQAELARALEQARKSLIVRGRRSTLDRAKAILIESGEVIANPAARSNR